MRRPTFAMAALLAAAAIAACATAADPAATNPGRTVVLGEQRFELKQDQKTIAVAPDFAAAEAIAVRPLNGDAECSRVVATFATGQTTDLPIEDERELTAGGTYWLALPKREQHLVGLEIVCRSVRLGAVDLQVLATADAAPPG